MNDLFLVGPNHGTIDQNGGGLFTGTTTTGSSTITASTTNVPGGGSTYCYVFNAVGAACWMNHAITTSDNFAIAQCRFRFDTLPSTGECTLLSFQTAASVAVSLVYSSTDGKIRARIGGSGTTGTTTIVANQDYRLDLRLDSNGTGWVVDGWLDGGDNMSFSNTQAGSSTVTGLRLGPLGAPTCQVRIANVVLRSNATNPTGPMNAMLVKASRPDADGTHSVGSGAFKDEGGNNLSNATTTAYQHLDDATPFTSTTDWIGQSAIDSTHYMELTLGNTSETTIIAARAIVGFHQGGTAKASIFSSSTESVIYSGSMSGGLQFAGTIITPSAAWTQTIFNALVARIGYATVVTTNPRWDVLMVEYAYEPSTSQTFFDTDGVTVTSTEIPPGGSATPTFHLSGLDGLGFQNDFAWSDDGTVALAFADVGGVHRSLDGGKTFTPKHEGLNSTADRQVAAGRFAPGSHDEAYFLAGPGGGLYRTLDASGACVWELRSGAVDIDGGNNDPNSVGLPLTHPRSTSDLITFGDTSGQGGSATLDSYILVESSTALGSNVSTNPVRVIMRNDGAHLSYAEMWDDVETGSAGTYNFSKLAIAAGMAVAENRKLQYRIRGGRHFPFALYPTCRSFTYSDVPTFGAAGTCSTDLTGITIPVPYTTGGTPNTVFINAAVALFQAVVNYLAANFPTLQLDLLHTTAFGGGSAELHESDQLLALSGGSFTNMKNAHVALIDGYAGITPNGSFGTRLEWPRSGCFQPSNNLGPTCMNELAATSTGGLLWWTQKNGMKDNPNITPGDMATVGRYGYQMIHDQPSANNPSFYGDPEWVWGTPGDTRPGTYDGVVDAGAQFIEIQDDCWKTNANKSVLFQNSLFYGSQTGAGGTLWMYTGSFNDGIYRTGDGGLTMTRIVGAANSNIYLRCVVVDTTDPTHLYAGAYGVIGGTGGIYSVVNANGSTPENTTAPSWSKMATPFNSVEDILVLGAGRVYVVGSIITRDGSGNITAEDDGVWKATNPTGTASSEWTRQGATTLPGSGNWKTITGRIRTGLPDQLWVGAVDTIPAGNGTNQMIFRSDDGGTTWTNLTNDSTKQHNTEYDASGEVWVGYADVPGGRLMTGNSMVVSALKINPADPDELMVAGRGGLWITHESQVTAPNWYPADEGLQVTINPVVASDPTTPGRAGASSVDWGFWYTTDYFATVHNNDPGGAGNYALAVDTSTTPGTYYVGGGGRDSNDSGFVRKNADVATITSWTDLNWPVPQRVFGLATRHIGATTYVLAASPGGGGIRLYDQSTWRTLLTTGFAPADKPTPKRIAVVWGGDNLAYVYDGQSGLWRGTTTTLRLDTWSLIWNQTSQDIDASYLAVEPGNSGRVFVSIGTGLHRLDNANTGSSVGNGITRTQITNVTDPGPIGYTTSNLLVLWCSTPTAQMLRVPSPGANNAPAWDDVADELFQGWGQYPNSMDLLTPGYIFCSGIGTGLVYANNAQTTTTSFTDTDTVTVTSTDGTFKSGSTVPVGDDPDTATITETETVKAVITDIDGVAVVESSFQVTGPPATPRPPSTRTQHEGITHLIQSRMGVARPVVEDWEAEEIANGGFGAATGTITRHEFRRKPHVYKAGARWQMWTHGGFLLWEGQLNDPVLDEDVVKLTGRGWSELANRDSGRILFSSTDYADWDSISADPHGYKETSETYESSAEKGRLVFRGDKDGDVKTGQRTGLVFWAEDNAITSVSGTVDNPAGATYGTNHSIWLRSSRGPDGSRTDEEKLASFSDGYDFTMKVGNRDADQISLELLRDGPDQALTQKLLVRLRRIRVRGLADAPSSPGDPADDPPFDAAEVAEEVAGRLGIDFHSEATGVNVLPLDHKDGTFADLLDYVSLLSGVVWRIIAHGHSTNVSRGPILHFCEPDHWFTSRGDGETNLLPLSRYNRVRVSFPTSHGRHRSIVVTTDDLGIRDPYEDTGWRSTLEVSIDHPQKDSDLAEALGERILELASEDRKGGDLKRQWLRNSDKKLVSAYHIRAGDKITIIDDPTTVRVASKHSTAEGVTLELETGLMEVESFLARRRRLGAETDDPSGGMG